MKHIGSVVLIVFLGGCAAPTVTVNVPADHPASVEGPEATYSPIPTRIATDSEEKQESAKETKGKDETALGSRSQMHHQSCGGMK